MRLLFLLFILGVGAYFSVPTREAHEAAAREFLQGYEASENQQDGISLDSIVGYVKGMMAGQGRYENWQLLSKYTVDLPGSSYLECYGAFTLVRCSEVSPSAS